MTVAIDNIHFFNFSGIMRYLNLLHVSLSLKDVCNISYNKCALQIRKNIHIFSLFIFLRLSLHNVSG